MDLALKSCPFCGNKNLHISKTPKISKDLQSFDMINSRISCLGCGADGPSIAFIEDIFKCWNNRIETGNRKQRNRYI